MYINFRKLGFPKKAYSTKKDVQNGKASSVKMSLKELGKRPETERQRKERCFLAK